jgi:hypothetical protein
VKLKTKPGGEEPAAHLRRRRTRGSQEQVQEVEDKLSVEPGGGGKTEASFHPQQATEAVHNTTIAQLQAKGRNPASTSLLVHVSSIRCHWLSPQFGKERLCPNSSLGKMIKKPQFTLHWQISKIKTSL